MSDLSRLQGSSRSTWAAIRLLQCIRGPRLRRFVHLGDSEVSLKLNVKFEV